MRALAGLLLLATGASSLSLSQLKHKERFHAHLRSLQAAAHGANALPPAQFYTQTYDHFDATNLATWQQRFWVNSSMWDGSGPVFFYVEGEGAGSALDVVQGQHVELAMQYGALVVALEHRGFGASLPWPSMTVQALRVQSTYQAIQDTAAFITSYLMPAFSLDLTKNKILTFGGSYPGSLSLWLRKRLPHLIHSAVSTSGPLEALADFQGYHNVVAASLANTNVGGSAACAAAVQAAFQAFDAAMINGTAAQQAAMTAKMSSCAPPTSADDVFWAGTNIAGQIDGIVQYNAEVPGMTIADVCAIMLNASYNAPVDAMAAVVQQSLSPGQTCLDNSYSDFIAQLQNATVDPSATGVGVSQWTWMTCTQFGFYQTCEAGTQCVQSQTMTLAGNYKICADAYGSWLSPAVNNAGIAQWNAMFGMYSEADLSRVLSVSGGVDPWHAIGITPANVQSPNQAVWLPNSAHCRPMFPSLPTDPAEVVAARAATAEILGQWLQQPY